MPHQRQRHIEDLLYKRIKSTPIVILNGARQVGKSFLARELLADTNQHARYVTLDNPVQQRSAQSSPTSFIERQKAKELLIIDEAQKAPILFDAIKEVVDQNRTPAQFVLLGSTEFSHKSKIREALTGRTSTLRLFPFNLSETRHEPLSTQLINPSVRHSLTEIRGYLERGGMPGIFALLDAERRLEQHLEWVDTTVNRDLQQVSGKGLVDSILAKRILEFVSQEMETSDADIAKGLRAHIRKVQSHLEMLKAIFVLVEIAPCVGSTGRSQHYICDVGIASSLGSKMAKNAKTWACLEVLSQLHYRGEFLQSKVESYRGPKGGRIDFVIQTKTNQKLAFNVLDFEDIRQQDVQILKSFKERHPAFETFALAPIKTPAVFYDVLIQPWGVLA